MNMRQLGEKVGYLTVKSFLKNVRWSCMGKKNIKKMLIIGGAIMALFFVFNSISDAKKYKVHEETTVVAGYVQEFGSSWYVDDILLQKTFKSGIRNPKAGDNIDLKLDSDGRVVNWKVKR